MVGVYSDVVEDAFLVRRLYHMYTASHAVCFERPVEPGYSSVLSTGVHGCSWFSLGFAVSFDSVSEFHK